MFFPKKEDSDSSEKLKNTLFDYTLTYLLEQPDDLISYSIDFFKKLRDTKTLIEKNSSEDSPSSSSSRFSEEEPVFQRRETRRFCVFAENYDPEEDVDEDYEIVDHPKTEYQRKWLADELKSIFLFRALDTKQLDQLLNAMFPIDVRQGDNVIKQGDDGDFFYLIEKGTFNAYVNSHKVNTYENKGSFGELALLYNQPRNATITAMTDGTLWALERMNFKRIVLKSIYVKRKMYQNFLFQVPLLQKLPRYDLMNLADALIPKTFKPFEIIIKQGDNPDGMYFVEEGTVKIAILDKNGKYLPMRIIEQGGYFGELALITDNPRAASAFAVGDVRVAFLDVEAFQRLMGSLISDMKEVFSTYEDQREEILTKSTSSVN